MTLNQLINTLKNLQHLLEREANRIILNNKNYIIQLNQDQLEQTGRDSESKKKIPYSPFTVRAKKRKGDIYQHTTLLDEGDFYDSFFLRKSGKLTYRIDATDWKRAKLTLKYGNDIFGLTIYSDNKLKDEKLVPQLTAFLRSKIK